MVQAPKDPGFTKEDIERVCNPGSYVKALALAKAGTFTITGGPKGVEARVQSERGTEHYNVLLGRSGVSVNAKCSCMDSRQRPGLCKHSAAVALVLLASGQELPPLAPRARTTAPRPPARPRKRSVSPSPDVIVEEPPLKRPCFPKAKAQAAAAATKSIWATTFYFRRLVASAMAGDFEAFSSNIKRFETFSEQEATTLLHKAILGTNASGAHQIVASLLEHPDGREVAVAGRWDELRRTPLHAAVAADRLEMCTALLQAGADVTMANGNGLTPLDLAKQRKVDTSRGDWRREDEMKVLLQEAMEKRVKPES